MDIVRVSKTLVQINDNIRIESGPLRKKAKATKELLKNSVTAGHYKEGAIDSLNKPIVLGEDMDYIDWKNPERCFNVYKIGEETCKDKDEKDVVIERYFPVSVHEDYEEALTAAMKLA